MCEQLVIPIFPLGLVVFPEQTLPLHIFEPRYLDMIADCRAEPVGDRPAPFGIALGEDSEVKRPVGCTVVVERVLNEYDDGRLDILTVGRDRYRILEIYSAHAYLTARVEIVADDADTLDPALIERVQQHYLRLNELLDEETGAHLEVPPPDSSYQLALAAGLDLDVRQTLLETTTENRRLGKLAEHFEKMIPQLEARLRERRKIRSNGHTRK